MITKGDATTSPRYLNREPMSKCISVPLHSTMTQEPSPVGVVAQRKGKVTDHIFV